MHPCRIAILPIHQQIHSARVAIKANPANATITGILTGYDALPAQHIAALTGKLWPSSGVKATVQFLDQPDAETKRKILLAANAWNKTANIQFIETNLHGDIRIARTRGQGYWSYLGQDNAHVSADQQTMNLDSFTSSTSDSEYNRVVKHEFGHYLGWPHEHTRKEIVSKIDPEEAYTYYLKYDGWNRQLVQEQVLNLTPDELLTALPIDIKSIMCYGFPAEIMKDHQPVPGGMDIDDEDYALAAKLYPKSGSNHLQAILNIDEAVFTRLEAGFIHTHGAKKALEAAKADLESKHKAIFV